MDLDKLQIAVRPGARPGSKVLILQGPLTIRTIFDFQNAARTETDPTLIVDFSGVPFIDSAGLGALVGACVASKKANRKMIFAGMNEQVNALVDMSHLRQFFSTFGTVEEAQAAVA
jgi:anti-sigma B factor antagonist